MDIKLERLKYYADHIAPLASKSLKAWLDGGDAWPYLSVQNVSYLRGSVSCLCNITQAAVGKMDIIDAETLYKTALSFINTQPSEAELIKYMALPVIAGDNMYSLVYPAQGESIGAVLEALEARRVEELLEDGVFDAVPRLMAIFYRRHNERFGDYDIDDRAAFWAANGTVKQMHCVNFFLRGCKVSYFKRLEPFLETRPAALAAPTDGQNMATMTS